MRFLIFSVKDIVVSLLFSQPSISKARLGQRDGFDLGPHLQDEMNTIAQSSARMHSGISLLDLRSNALKRLFHFSIP
jgi:hypothetical protein